MIKNTKSKAKSIMLHIDAEEIKRIVENQLGGITLEIITSHANTKIIAKTGENQKVDYYLFK